MRKIKIKKKSKTLYIVIGVLVLIASLGFISKLSSGGGSSSGGGAVVKPPVCKHEMHDIRGFCVNCGEQIGHTYVDGVCSVCNRSCSHGEHDNDGVCSFCSIVCCDNPVVDGGTNWIEDEYYHASNGYCQCGSSFTSEYSEHSFDSDGRCECGYEQGMPISTYAMRQQENVQ